MQLKRILVFEDRFVDGLLLLVGCWLTMVGDGRRSTVAIKWLQSDPENLRKDHFDLSLNEQVVLGTISFIIFQLLVD